MRSTGSALAISSFMDRDFELNDRVSSLLSECALWEDTEAIDKKHRRISSTLPARLDLALMGVSDNDAIINLEHALISRALDSIERSRASDRVVARVSFRPDPSDTRVAINVVYSCGERTASFEVLADQAPVSESDVLKVIQEKPILAWLLDERSPLFSKAGVALVKRALIFRRLSTAELNRNDARGFDFILKKLLGQISDDDKVLVDEVRRAEKNIKTSIRNLCRSVRPKFEKNEIDFKPNEGGRRFVVIEIQVTADECESFSYFVGASQIIGSGPESKLYAGAFVVGREPLLPRELFNGNYAKADLSPDLDVLKYILARAGYRKSLKRSEKIFAVMLPVFPSFSYEVTDDLTLARISRSARLELQVAGHERFSLFSLNERISQIVALCASCRIQLGGSITIVGSDGRTIIHVWNFEDDFAMSKPSAKGLREIFVNSQIEIRFKSDSKLTNLEILGVYLNAAVSGSDLISAI